MTDRVHEELSETEVVELVWIMRVRHSFLHQDWDWVHDPLNTVIPTDVQTVINSHCLSCLLEMISESDWNLIDRDLRRLSS